MAAKKKSQTNSVSVKNRCLFLLVVLGVMTLFGYIFFCNFFREPNKKISLRECSGKDCYQQDLPQAEPEQPAAGENFSLGLGESKNIADGTTLVLNEINDSRCQPDVQCIWAGEIKVTIKFLQNSIENVASLGLGENITLDGWNITFVEATPPQPANTDASQKTRITFSATYSVLNPTEANSVAVEYINNQYGFKFALPENWKNYSIINMEWYGSISDSVQGEIVTENGPIFYIRHPQWTVQNPRQDIPIMVFTVSQWEALQQDKFHIGAAPINPSELGYNSNYVFALPARYNYAFPIGFEEVENILQNHPLKNF